MALRERKYDIENNRLVKRDGKIPLPEDEPLFVLRAQDKYALVVLGAYYALTQSLPHKEAVLKVIKDFQDFERKHPDRMKYPDV